MGDESAAYDCGISEIPKFNVYESEKSRQKRKDAHSRKLYHYQQRGLVSLFELPAIMCEKSPVKSVFN